MERDCVCVWDADRDCVWLWVGDSVSVMLWLGDSVSVDRWDGVGAAEPDCVRVRELDGLRDAV